MSVKCIYSNWRNCCKYFTGLQRYCDVVSYSIISSIEYLFIHGFHFNDASWPGLIWCRHECCTLLCQSQTRYHNTSVVFCMWWTGIENLFYNFEQCVLNCTIFQKSCVQSVLHILHQSFPGVDFPSKSTREQ